MGATVSTGPTISAGPLLGGTLVPDNNPSYGPGGEYQGTILLDIRQTLFASPEFRPASVKGHLDSPYILFVDYVPAAAGTATIAALANVTNGTAMTLAATNTAGITQGIPFYPFGSSTLTTAPITLDYGFSTLNVTSGSATATPATGTVQYYYVGQWLVLAATTTPQIVQVTAVGASTITLSVAANGTSSTARVGGANIQDPTATAPATSWSPYLGAGVMFPLNPIDCMTRTVSITGVASGTGGAFAVRGWDIYGAPMTETITATAGATTVIGKKAFKMIGSVTPAFTDAHNYSVGTSDYFGLHLRSDRWEYANFYANGTFLSTSAGWTAGDQTSPATGTTGDVRGTINMGSGGGAQPSDGTKRYALFMTIPLYNLAGAGVGNTAPMYGVTQYAG